MRQLFFRYSIASVLAGGLMVDVAHAWPWSGWSGWSGSGTHSYGKWLTGAAALAGLGWSFFKLWQLKKLRDDRNHPKPKPIVHVDGAYDFSSVSSCKALQSDLSEKTLRGKWLSDDVANVIWEYARPAEYTHEGECKLSCSGYLTPEYAYERNNLIFIPSNKRIHELKLHMPKVCGQVAISQDNQYLAYAAEKGVEVIKIQDLESKIAAGHFFLPSNGKEVVDICFFDRTLIGVLDDSDVMTIWNVSSKTRKAVHNFKEALQGLEMFSKRRKDSTPDHVLAQLYIFDKRHLCGVYHIHDNTVVTIVGASGDIMTQKCEPLGGRMAEDVAGIRVLSGRRMVHYGHHGDTISIWGFSEDCRKILYKRVIKNLKMFNYRTPAVRLKALSYFGDYIAMNRCHKQDATHKAPYWKMTYASIDALKNKELPEFTELIDVTDEPVS